MSDPSAVPVSSPVDTAQQAMPVPFGVAAETGNTRPPLSAADLAQIPGDLQAVQARACTEGHLALIPTLHPMDLAQTGWGVVFAADIDPAVKAALQPLLAHREQQVGNQRRFKTFEGNRGVRPGQSAIDWLDRQGVGLAVVDPRNGVPYYLLLVGSPMQISFEFQCVLDMQWCVGRVYFDTPAEYESWAHAVVDYETSASLPHRKQAAMWMPRHAGDAATAMLLSQVGIPFVQQGLGTEAGYTLQAFVDAQATKEQLANILHGRLENGPPAVLFTGSHGLEWPKADTPGQRVKQGALITQEWVPHTPAKPEHYFSASDLGDDSNVQGMICFLFAYFGGGCPVLDTYGKQPDGSPIQIAPEPMIAQLPQRLLSRGALAVLAHVDRVWSWSFQSGSGLPQNQVIRSTIEAVMQGARVGQASDFFNLQWSTLAALWGVLQGHAAGQPVSPVTLGNLCIARGDTRNYTVLGDPAARLRVETMQA
jgi:hypothetical protein